MLKVFGLDPVVGGKCHSYEWRTSAWSDNVREVWCQRSDGVNVTGIATATLTQHTFHFVTEKLLDLILEDFML